MSKKDYIKFAEMIRKAKISLIYASTNRGETERTIELISDMMGNIFSQDNPNFSWDKWTDYINK